MALKRSVKARKPSTRVPFKKRAKKAARRRITTSDILREYGLPESIVKGGKWGLRYKQPIERGVLWYYFSLWIRQRDKDLPCINCGLFKEDMHGGHFVAAGKASWDDMVFSEKNVNAECSFCNLRDKSKLKYEYNLDLKYGAGTAQALKAEYHDKEFNNILHKNWSKDVLKEKIAQYRNEIHP